MSHLLPGFQRNAAGRIIHRYFDGAEWPVDGWYDSPDKVPGTLPGQLTGEDLPPPQADVLGKPKPYGAYGTVYGEKTKEQKAHEQAKGSKRSRGGRFQKAGR